MHSDELDTLERMWNEKVDDLLKRDRELKELGYEVDVIAARIDYLKRAMSIGYAA